MRPPRNPIPLPIDARPDEKRRHGRLRAEMLNCELGQVVDISLSGMRVLSRNRRVLEVGQALQLDLQALDRAVPVQGRIAWSRKLGWRRYEVGITFVDLDESIRDAIRELGRYVAATADYQSRQ